MMLIRCLVRLVDQTESLPLHLFDQVMHPTVGEHLKRNVLVCVGGEETEISSAADFKVTQETGASCSSSAYGSDDVPELKRNVEIESVGMLPRGLIAPPLLHPDSHERLTGGVSGLVDRRVLLLLDLWFPHFISCFCSGSFYSDQVNLEYYMDFEQHPVGVMEILLSSGRKRSLVLLNKQEYPFYMVKPFVIFLRKWISVEETIEEMNIGVNTI